MPSEKTLKRIVITLGVLIVFGFMTLVGIIIYRLVNPKVQIEEPIEGLIMSTPENPVKLIRHGKGEKITIFIFENNQGKQSVMIIDNQTNEVLGHIPLDQLDENIAKLADPD